MEQVTKKYIAGLVALLKAEYPRDFESVSKETLLGKIDLWHKSLARYPKPIVDAAFQRVLETCTYPPKLANILQAVGELKEATEPTPTELWEELLKATRRATEHVRAFHYTFVEANGLTQGENAKRAFKAIWAQMPELLQEYCGNESGLIAFTRYSHDELAFEKGRFLKTLPTLKKRQEIKQTMAPEILQLVGGTFKEIASGAGKMLLKDTEK